MKPILILFAALLFGCDAPPKEEPISADFGCDSATYEYPSTKPDAQSQ